MDELKNNHHLIPRSKWWLSWPNNVEQVDIKEHARWHWWCGNDTPIEAICRVLLWNDKVWSENFKADLMDVLDNYLNNYYAKKTHSWFIKSEVRRVLDLEDTIINDNWQQ